MPGNPVYRATGTSHHTATRIGSSGPSDQHLDQANLSRRINSSVISGSQPSGVPVYHANIHALAYLRDFLSSPAGVSLSLIRSPTSGHLKTPDHHRKVTRLLSSKTQAVFIIFAA